MTPVDGLAVTVSVVAEATRGMLPDASWVSAVPTPEQLPAMGDCAAVAMASFAAAPGFTVSVCVAFTSPFPEAMSARDPAVEALKENVALVWLAPMVMEVTAAPAHPPPP